MINNKTDIQSESNIKPLKKNTYKKPIVIGVVSTFAVFVIVGVVYANKSNIKFANILPTAKQEVKPKIENTENKKFDTLPEQAQAHSFASETAPNDISQQDISSIPASSVQATQAENSPLCRSCNTNQITNNSIATNNSNIEQSEIQIPELLNKNNNNFQELDVVQPQVSQANIIRNQRYLLTKGAFLNAILETNIDSTRKGLVSAILAEDIYSADGSVLLMERGSKVLGQQTQGVQEGIERLMVIWDRLITPHGITINLNSLGTDSLGGAGLDANINHQYAKKFGAAILLSIIDDSLAIASNKSNITNNIQNTQQQAQELATQALSNTINIQPIATKKRGEYIGIFISRDLDFSKVYNVRLAN